MGHVCALLCFMKAGKFRGSGIRDTYPQEDILFSSLFYEKLLKKFQRNSF